MPEKPLGGVALAVVLGVAVLLDDRLRHQGDDLAELRMDERRPQQLMRIRDGTRLALLLQARGAMNGLGGEVGRAIQGQEVAALEEDQGLQRLAALPLAEDVRERGAQACGSDGRKEPAE